MMDIVDNTSEARSEDLEKLLQASKAKDINGLDNTKRMMDTMDNTSKARSEDFEKLSDRMMSGSCDRKHLFRINKRLLRFESISPRL